MYVCCCISWYFAQVKFKIHDDLRGPDSSIIIIIIIIVCIYWSISNQKTGSLFGGMKITVFDGKSYFIYYQPLLWGILLLLCFSLQYVIWLWICICTCLNYATISILQYLKPSQNQNCIQFQFMTAHFLCGLNSASIKFLNEF